MFASCGIESKIAVQATPLVVLGAHVPVARVAPIAMRLLSRDPKQRPRDEGDLLALRDVADDHEWQCAEASVRSIGDRGFARGRLVIESRFDARSPIRARVRECFLDCDRFRTRRSSKRT